jgi:hypothetical protein
MNRKRTKVSEAVRKSSKFNACNDNRLVRDEGVGGSNPLTPTNDLAIISSISANETAN